MYARNGYDAREMRLRGWVGNEICGPESGLAKELGKVAAVRPPALRTERFSRNARLVSESIRCMYPAGKRPAESSISFRARHLTFARFARAAIHMCVRTSDAKMLSVPSLLDARR